MGMFNHKKKGSFDKISCRCGHKFKFNWSNIPEEEKIVYLQCPKCQMELKIANPKYSDKEINYNNEFYRMVTNLWKDGKNSYVDLKQVEKMIEYVDLIDGDVLTWSYIEHYDATTGQEASEGLSRGTAQHYKKMELYGSIIHRNIEDISIFLSFISKKGKIDEKWFADEGIYQHYYLYSIQKGKLFCKLIKKLYDKGIVSSTEVVGGETTNWDDVTNVSINYDYLLDSIKKLNEEDFDVIKLIETNIKEYLKKETKMNDNAISMAVNILVTYKKDSYLQEFYYAMTTNKFPYNPQTNVYVGSKKYDAESLCKEKGLSLIDSYICLIQLKEFPQKTIDKYDL